MTKKTTVNWEAIRQDYVAGVLSIREIARQAGVSHTAVAQKAKELGWERNLADRVRLATSAKLQRKVARDVSGVSSEDADREIVEVNAQMRVQVILGQRKDIARLRAISSRLSEDLETIVAHRKSLEQLIAEIFSGNCTPTISRQAIQRAVQIGPLATTLETLCRTMRLQHAMERQAFGIDDHSTSPEGMYEYQLRRLYEQAQSMERVAYAASEDATKVN